MKKFTVGHLLARIAVIALLLALTVKQTRQLGSVSAVSPCGEYSAGIIHDDGR